MFQNRLAKVYRHLSRIARKQGISCYRLYDRDLPEFPLIIELYEDRVYLAEYKSQHSLSEAEYLTWLEGCYPVISEVLQVDESAIYTRMRKRKSGRDDQYNRVGAAEAFFVVKEAGLNFRVNLSDYLDTGLFLDHRLTRGMVRGQAAGKKVLNLFCYTGSFSVYAAAGGAAEVVSVDLSNTYLQWAEANFALNQLDANSAYQFIRADVLQYLDQLPRNYFDLVVIDPPTFSNSKMMKDFLDIQRDHVRLLNQVLAATKTGGQVYFSTNSRKFQLNSAQVSATTIKDITRATTPFDFEGKLLRWCYLLTK